MRFSKVLMVCTLTGAALVPASVYAGGPGAATSVGIGAGIGASTGATGANFGGGIGTSTGLMGGASASAPGASISNAASGGMGVGTWRDHTSAGAGVETSGEVRANTHRRPARAVSSGAAKARGIANSGRRASAAVQAEGGASGAVER